MCWSAQLGGGPSDRRVLETGTLGGLEAEAGQGELAARLAGAVDAFCTPAMELVKPAHIALHASLRWTRSTLMRGRRQNCLADVIR